MKLTRHAKNRVRRIRKLCPEVTTGGILRALLAGAPQTVDATGRTRVWIVVAEQRIVAVIDRDERVVITVWLKER